MAVTLAPGVTGLLPNGAIQSAASRKSLEKLGAGEAINVRIKDIDTAARRISLAPAGEEGGVETGEKDWKRHAPKPAPAPSIGALGLAMKAALQKKNK